MILFEGLKKITELVILHEYNREKNLDQEKKIRKNHKYSDIFF